MNRSFLAGICWLAVAGNPVWAEEANRQSDAAAPVVIHIVNPDSTGVTWNYLIDDAAQTLLAGYSQQIDSSCTITFDRSGGLGEAKYTLSDGTYTFTPADGHWELYRTENAAAADSVAGISTTDEGTTKADPVTPLEKKMFQEMYGKAGLDAATMKLVEEDWQGKTHAERKTDYDSLMEQIAAARAQSQGKSAEITQTSATTPVVPAPAMSEEDKQMFWGMYRDAGLDQATLKLVSDDWKSKTSAERKAEYDSFMKQVAELRQSANKQARQSNDLP